MNKNRKKYQRGGLDANNLSPQSTPTNSALDYLDQGSSGLSPRESFKLMDSSPQRGGTVLSASARSAGFEQRITADESYKQQSMYNKGYMTPEFSPEMYKTIYQGNMKNSWNTLFNDIREQDKGGYEYEVAKIRMKLAEYETAKKRADDFYAEGLISADAHSQILANIETNTIGSGQHEDLVDQLLDGVLTGMHTNLSAEDYTAAVQRAEDANLLNRSKLERSLSNKSDTYASLLEDLETVKGKIADREEEITEGGWGSIGGRMFSGLTGVGDKWYQQGLPLPLYGGGDVAEDYSVRSAVEKNMGATALSSIPIISPMFGLSDKFMGDEYFEYKAAQDLAGTISTFEGQVAAILGPALVQTIETQISNKLLNGIKNPYIRSISALLQFGTIAAGNWYSRNLETKMEAGDAYWQKVDMLEQAWKQDLKKKGEDRELTEDEKNKIAILAGDGLDELFEKNMALGGSDIIQFALTFMKMPGLSKAFTGSTFRNLAARQVGSRFWSRGLVKAGTFATGVGISRELEGMEEGLQYRWAQDYLGGYNQERSGSWLNNVWNSTKDAAVDAVDYGMNMSGLRRSNPDMYESLAFKHAVQSGRDMATMLTGGGRTLSNWGGARTFVELNNAINLLGENGDALNAENLLEQKKDLLYKYFDEGKEGDLYDAIYRMGRKGGLDGFSKEDAINTINEIQQAKQIYDDVFDDKSPLAISAFGLEYDIGKNRGIRGYTQDDKKHVFNNAMDIVNKEKRNEELTEKQEAYRRGKDESLDLYTTALTSEEQAEYDNPETSAERKKELSEILKEAAPSSEQKESLRNKMKERGLEVTPYDLEILENQESIEQAKKANEEIATEEKTFIENKRTGHGALWGRNELRQYLDINKEITEILKKEEMTQDDRTTLNDLILEKNKILYEQAFEYTALKKGQFNNKVKRAVAMHGIGEIMQHIEKYGVKGLDRILPSILENNAKMDPQTLEDLARLADEVVTTKQELEQKLADIEKMQQDIKETFNNQTLQKETHEPLTPAEQEDIKRLRTLEEEVGELSREEKAVLNSLVDRGLKDKTLKELTIQAEEIKAEVASLNDTANMSEKFVARLEKDSSSFEFKDELFDKISNDKILEEAALEAMEGMDYLASQLEHLPEYADVATAERIYQNIKGRLEIFKRRLVEAPEGKKDYMQNIVDQLQAAEVTMKGLLTTIKENAADRTAEQTAFEERTFNNLLQSLGLKPNFTIDDKSLFKNIGAQFLTLLGDNVNILRNALIKLEEGATAAEGVIMGMTDKMAVALVAVELIKLELNNQPELKNQILEGLKTLHREQAQVVADIVEKEISTEEQEMVATDYKANPENGITGLLHNISTLDADLDLNNRESALWKYVDHLDTSRLIEDIAEEDRSNRKVSSEVLLSLLGHHIQSQSAVKLFRLLTSNFDTQAQLINEEVLVRTKAESFIPTKQQINAIRELSVFLNRNVSFNSEDFNLGDISSFLQGAAGTGKSKIVLPWALHTAGIVNNKVFAIGHNDSSSKTINEALGLEGVNTFADFIDISDDDASDLKVLVIDEAPSLSDIQYTALHDKVLDINTKRAEAGESLLKVIMLGDEAQITTETTTPLSSFDTFSRMDTYITPVTNIYRSDNPAISTFQDIFRRRRDDISNEEIIVKLNQPNPWSDGALGVYGVSGNFKERLLLKLQNPVSSDIRRVIITTPEKVEGYNAFLKTNQIQNVEVLSFIDAQGETINEVYMDIERGNMQALEYNKALYTAASRAQDLIVVANLNLKNTLDSEMSVVQDTLSSELEARRIQFEEETKDNTELLKKFEDLKDPEDLLSEEIEEDDDSDDGDQMEEIHRGAPTIEEEERDEHSEDAAPQEEEEIVEEQANEEDKKDSWITEGEDITEDDNFSEDAFDSDNNSTAYTEGGDNIQFNKEIDVKNKHVLYYPEYDGLSSTVLADETIVLPIQDNQPVLFVKTQTVGRDGNLIEGIIVVQPARTPVEGGQTIFRHQNKPVFRRVAVIGNEAEIDEMGFLNKIEKEALKYQLNHQPSIQFTELAEAGDKSLLVDNTGFAAKSNLIKGIIIPPGGARRLAYKYKSRAELHENSPRGENFQKENKGLIKRLLKQFIEQFYDQKQSISPEQQRNIKESRVKVFKKKDIQELARKGQIPNGFNLKSGMPYLVIKGVESVGSKSKTQYIALTPRRLSANIKDDVKNYFKPLSEFTGVIYAIEKLTEGNLKLGTKTFVDFIKGTDNNVKRIALSLGKPKLVDKLIQLRDTVRELKWDIVETNPSGSISKQTRGTGRAQLAMDRLARANSIFREEKRTMIKGKKVRRVVSKSILSYPGKRVTARGPITSSILNAVFSNQDSKGYNQVLYVPIKMSDFRDIDYSGVSSKFRSAEDNHKSAEKYLTSQLESIESTKIVLDKSETMKEKEEEAVKKDNKPAPIKVKKPKKKKKRRGNLGGTDSLTGDEFRDEGTEEGLKGDYITKDDAKWLLKSLLPDLFNKHGDLIPGNVVFLDSLRMLELSESSDVLGKFINQRIFLLEERDGILDNVIRHEVFHKIVSYYLTKKEREILFSTARVKYNLPAFMTNSEVEERLAREFMKFRRNENSVPAVIRRIFKKIAKFLGFINKNADNIEKLFDNIDSGYFSGKRMVGDPIDTNMNYQDIEKNWGSIEIYREARSRFVIGMSSLLGQYDSVTLDGTYIISEVDHESGTISETPMSRDEALEYLIDDLVPEQIEAFEKIGLDNLNIHQMNAYKGVKALGNKRLAKYMFADVYQRDQFTQGYELEEDTYLDTVNLMDVIENANSKDHNKNLTESVIEFLTGITYQTADGKTKRLTIPHAYYKILQMLSDTDSINYLEFRRNIVAKSNSLGHKKGSAGWAVKEAIVDLIDTAFMNQVIVGEGRADAIRLRKELSELKGKTKAIKAKRKRLQKKLENAENKTSILPMPKNMHFVNNDLFVYSEDIKVEASDILYDIKQQDIHSAIARKKGEASEDYYYRIYEELNSKGIGVPAELLIALNRKNKADRDLKNIFVNTASLREENFMMGDYEYKFDSDTKQSKKSLRYYKHKEFGTRSIISSDIQNFIEEHIVKIQNNAPKILAKIQNKGKAIKEADKREIAKNFMNLIGYPAEKVILSPKELDNVIMKLEGFLKEVPKVGKRDQSAKKIVNDKGREVYPLFTISDLLDDEKTFVEALGDMLKLEHEGTKAHSIRNVEGKTIYAYHNSSFGIDILSGIISNRKDSTPLHLQKNTKSYDNIYQFNIFANGKSELREIHDWDGIIDKKRKYTPVTYSQESEKGWLDRNFNYWFVNGLKESKDSLYYTQQLTTVSDKSSPKAAQVQLLTDQQIVEAVKAIVEQYHKKPIKKSLVFSNILNNSNLNKAQKVSRILEEFNKRTDELVTKMQTEGLFDRISSDLASARANLRDKKYLKKPKGKKAEKELQENNKDLASVFVANYAINSFFLNQIVLGDTAKFKDSYDVVKRMSIAFAPGYRGFVNPIIGMKNTFRVAVMEDPQGTAFDFLAPKERTALLKDLKDLGLDKAFELADGQGFVLPSRLKDLRKGFGGGLKAGTVMKPVYYGIDENGDQIALKYSTVVLTNDLVSKHKGLKALRDVMEGSEVDELVMKSAVKIGAPNKEDLSKHGYSPWRPGKKGFKLAPKINPNSIKTLNNKYLRLQLDPVHDANTLVSNPSQLAYMINTNGLNSVEAQEYYETMAQIIDLGTKEFFHGIGLMSNGQIRDFSNLKPARRKSVEAKIRKKILQGTKIQESAHKEAEILHAKDVNGNPAVTINFPGVVNKVFSVLSSALSKATIKIKFPGSKLVLQTGYGASVYETQLGEVLLQDDLIDLAAEAGVTLDAYIKDSGIIERPLKHITADRPYAEVLMPRVHSKKFKIGDEIYQNEYMMGFRIPSTELHSSVALKVVGFYDSLDTNVVIAPKELQTIHGSDFDVDSLFVIRKAHATDTSKSGNKLYTNSDKGLVSRNDKLYFTTGDVIPSDDKFLANLIIDMNEIKNKLKELNTKIGQSIVSEDIEIFKETKKAHKKLLKILETVQQAALKNKMLDIYLKVLKKPENRNSILSPITMNNLKGDVVNGVDINNSVFDIISKDLGLVLKEDHSQLYETRDLSNPLDELYMHQSNQQGSILTGAGANAMKALVYMMEAARDGGPSYLIHSRTQQKDGTIDIIPFSFEIDGVTYSELSRYEKHPKNKFSTNTIWATMDSIINAAIDNAKEQILNIINMNRATASMFYVMIGTGVPLHTAVRILLQPAVKEAARLNPKDFSKGATQVRELINKKLAESNYTAKALESQYAEIKLISQKLSKGIKRTNPKFKNSLDKQLGTTVPDLLFQLKVLELLSPGGKKRGLNKFGSDLTKVATTLNILRKLPSNHEELTDLTRDMAEMFNEDSNLSLEISGIETALPHLKAARETSDHLYSMSGHILDVNNPGLVKYAEEISDILGLTSKSEDNTTATEKYKIIREEFIRYLASSLVDTTAIDPIIIKRGDIETIASGTEALSHRVAEEIAHLKSEIASNSFINRISVKTDRRGIKYIVGNSKGILQPELVQVYSDFSRLNPKLQESLLLYTIAKEGMLFAASNITMLMRPELYGAREKGSIGYDKKRSDLLFKLVKREVNTKTGISTRLENSKESFMVQYALSNINQIASLSSKKISQAVVSENNSIFGTRRKDLTTGETVFYDLKIDQNLLPSPPRFISNPNYGQVYVLVHSDVKKDGTGGNAYYQTIAKGSATSSLYSVKEAYLSEPYSINDHFKKNTLVRPVNDITTESIELFSEVKGLKEGDKMLLRTHDDRLRINAVQAIVTGIEKVETEDSIKWKVSLAKHTPLSNFKNIAAKRYAAHVASENKCN
jgi:hypothetical protein